nr:hypothetical protein [Bacillus subtilis]WEZ63266.1 hypothetical protein P5657_20260 [Bacillus subtilis]
MLQQQSRFRYLFNPYTLYCLLEFNITKNNVEKLVEEEFVVNDFLVVSNKVAKMQIKKKRLSQNVIDAVSSLSEAVYEQSVYKLGAAGLSTVNIKLLADHGITYPQLASMPYDVFFERIGQKNKRAIFERIKEAYNACETLFQLDISDKVYNFYLRQYCDLLAPRYYVTVDFLCDILSSRLSLLKAEVKVSYIEQFLEKKNY